MYNVFFLTFLFIKESWKKNLHCGFHKILICTTIFNIDKNNKYLLNIKSA